jgi:NADH:ubiquinone oxidoreductase subunit C
MKRPLSERALKEKILQLSPAVSFEEGGQWLTINVAPADWRSLAEQLRNEESLFFNFLFCLTCIDWKTHLTMVYHLESVSFRHNIVIKSKLDATDSSIATVSDIWQTANFHEREVYEMFGVNFINHPDLRLLILPDGWENKRPLLKNFEDPINMIKL